MVWRNVGRRAGLIRVWSVSGVRGFIEKFSGASESVSPGVMGGGVELKLVF